MSDCPRASTDEAVDRSVQVKVATARMCKQPGFLELNFVVVLTCYDGRWADGGVRPDMAVNERQRGAAGGGGNEAARCALEDDDEVKNEQNDGAAQAWRTRWIEGWPRSNGMARSDQRTSEKQPREQVGWRAGEWELVVGLPAKGMQLCMRNAHCSLLTAHQKTSGCLWA